MASFDYLVPVQDLYYGFFPDAPDPLYYKWNYQSDFVVERKKQSCYECLLEETMGFPTRIALPIGEYHMDGRFSTGKRLMYNKPQPCSKFIKERIDNLDYQRHLDKYGLFWIVPWRSSKLQQSYLPSSPCLTPHEMDPASPAAWTTDKVNSSLLMTAKGPIRFQRGIFDTMGRPLGI